MNSDRRELNSQELVSVSAFSIGLVAILLFVTGYSFGYDLFWEQLGASIVFYLTILAGILSILKKGIRPVNFFQIFFLFMLLAFPSVAYLRADQPPLIIDDFETGIGGWTTLAAPGTNSSIQEQARGSPFGSWHLVWSVENCCEKEGDWAIIEYCTCPPEVFSLDEFKRIEFWYKTGSNEGFVLEIRCPDYSRAYHMVIDPNTNWRNVSLVLPKGNSSNDFSVHLGENESAPLHDKCHIAFASSGNNTYHIDYIKLESLTVWEKYPSWIFLGEILTVILVLLSFGEPVKRRIGKL